MDCHIDSTHVKQLTNSLTPALRDLMSSSGSLEHLHTQSYTDTQHVNNNKNKDTVINKTD